MYNVICCNKLWNINFSLTEIKAVRMHMQVLQKVISC